MRQASLRRTCRLRQGVAVDEERRDLLHWINSSVVGLEVRSALVYEVHCCQERGLMWSIDGKASLYHSQSLLRQVYWIRLQFSPIRTR